MMNDENRTMSLPDDLQLSQGSLQDFVECRRRFQLRYVLDIDWPAIEAEPALEAERHLQLGALFHRMIQQHVLGVPAGRLAAMAQDPEVARWWQNYLDHGASRLPGTRHPELVLSAPLGEHRLVAKYDLVTVTPDGLLTVFDWKTSRRLPSRLWLEGRLQTRVYPYLLVEAGQHVGSGAPVQPSQVEMVYWFANFPDRPERFAYSARQHQENTQYLGALLQEMKLLSQAQADWPLTQEEQRCRFCIYRSLCDRGIQAGSLEESGTEDLLSEGDLVVDLDFEQIAEIEF